MQLALLADVHGNFEALKTVLRDIDRRAPGARLVCAGDMVGYGPDPDACLDLLASREALLVLGNHEEMVLGRRDFSRCVSAGIAAALWTREHLSAASEAAISRLPTWREATAGIIICHGDLESADTYVCTPERARAALGQLRARSRAARVLVCGHTHHALFFTEAQGLVPVPPGTELFLPRSERCLVNPGAVGQERQQRAPLARYAVLDLERGAVVYVALPYDHGITERKARRAGLTSPVVLLPPRGLARRIEHIRTRRAQRRAERRTQVEAHKRQAPATTPVPRVTFSPTRFRRRLFHEMQRGMSLCGAASALSKLRPVEGATIVVYHSVVDEADSPWVDPRFSVPLGLFERQMRFLTRKRRVVRLDALIEMLRRGQSPPEGTVVITFDDGYKSVLEKAAPVLAHYELPAVLFLPTGIVSRSESQWTDVLYAGFNFRTRHILDLPHEGIGPMHLRDSVELRAAYLAISERLIHTQKDHRDRLLGETLEQLRPSRRPPRLILDWDEIARLRRMHPGFDLGVHTRNHLDLTACDPDTLAEEVSGSVRDLWDALRLVARSFSFPYGRSNATSRDAVIQAGLASAVVTDPPALIRAGADLFTLPRYSAPPNLSMFSFVTSGAHPKPSLAVL